MSISFLASLLVASSLSATACGTVLDSQDEPPLPPDASDRGDASVSGAVQVGTAAYRSCALTSRGGVACWGHDYVLSTNSLTAVEVAGVGLGIRSIAVGEHVTCALTAADAVVCWGENDHGQLGNGSFVRSTPPVDVVGLGPVTSIATGFYHTCAVIAAGGVKCWGAGHWGALGNGATTDSSIPVAVVGLAAGVRTVVAGWDFTCALSLAGGVKCWGDNSWGQLGNNSTTGSAVPVDVVGLSSGVTDLVSGRNTACAIVAGGRVKCWGNNDSGQLGTGAVFAHSTVPVEATILAPGIATLAIGAAHACAATAAGSVACWGANDHGQLGDGGTTSRATPAMVHGLGAGVRSISAGMGYGCAITMTGAVVCWGSNGSGQLGDGSTIDGAVPTIVRGLP